MKRNMPSRPVGVTIIGWLLIVSGGLYTAHEMLGRIWNITMGESTRTFIKVGAPIGTQVLLLAFILIGIGMLKLSRAAYVSTFLITSLFLARVVLWWIDLRKHDSIGEGFSLIAVVFLLIVLVYLGRKPIRSKFFSHE